MGTYGRQFTYDFKSDSYFPSDGRTFYNATDKRICSNFCENVLDSNWDVNSGSDAQALDPAILTTAGEGICRLVGGNLGNDLAAEDMSALAGPAVHYEAEEGILKFRCRYKIDDITAVRIFMGYTDVLPSGTLEAPWSLSGTTFTSTASDSCGILFDTEATTDTIRMVGVAGDTEGTPIDTAIAPVNATWMDVVMRVSVAGLLEVEIDGTDYGNVAAALTVGTDVVPIVCVLPTGAASRTLDIDFLACS